MRTQAQQIAALTQEAERLGLGVSVIARLAAHVVEAEERGLARAHILRATAVYDAGSHLDLPPGEGSTA